MTRLEYMLALRTNSRRAIAILARLADSKERIRGKSLAALLSEEIELWVRRSRAVDLEVSSRPEGRYDDRALFPEHPVKGEF